MKASQSPVKERCQRMTISCWLDYFPEYSHLYNGQYAQLTSLQKSADPRGESSAYLEAALKSHYPKVYVDMIKNDYI